MSKSIKLGQRNPKIFVLERLFDGINGDSTAIVQHAYSEREEISTFTMERRLSVEDFRGVAARMDPDAVRDGRVDKFLGNIRK